MATYIVLASVLAVIQFWVIPFLINVKNLNWQMSNRDESLDDSVLLKEQEEQVQIFWKHYLSI